MSRRAALKVAVDQVPASREDADRLLGEIGALQRRIETIDIELTDAVALAKAEASRKAKPLADELKAKLGVLATWAEASRGELLDGKRRSAAMSQGTIGWRMGMPTVKVSRGQEEALIATFQRLGLSSLLRERVELDKEAILKAPDRIEGIAGIGIEQVESFWAKPLDVRTELATTSVKLKGVAAVRQPDEEAA